MINARGYLPANERAYIGELVRAAEHANTVEDLEEGIRMYENHMERDRQSLGFWGRIKHTVAGKPLALKGINPLVEPEDAYRVAKAVYAQRTSSEFAELVSGESE